MKARLGWHNTIDDSVNSAVLDILEVGMRVAEFMGGTAVDRIWVRRLHNDEVFFEAELIDNKHWDSWWY